MLDEAEADTHIPPSIDHRSIAVLGIVTIAAYGSWYYAFGVLIDPIRADTGWRESSLAASFSIGTAVVGMVSLLGGRLLDRVGHRVAFLIGAAVSGSGLLVAAQANSMGVFGLGAVLALAGTGSLGFYHVTMTTAVWLHPRGSARAIAVLTVWGAFASVIYLPTTSWLEASFGWRPTVRVLAGAVVGAFVLGAVALPDARLVRPAVARQPTPMRAVIRRTTQTPERVLFTVAVASGGIAMSTLLVYQVPAMTAAGLPAATAATVAGLRGFAQLGGRLPLGWLLDRIGSTRSLLAAFGAIALGGLLLAVSSSVPVAMLFAVTAGFGIGAFSPLQGIRTEELFDHDDLGVTMGFYASVLLLFGSIGPVVAGALSESTGDRRWAAVTATVAASVAVVAVLAGSRPGKQSAAGRASHSG